MPPDVALIAVGGYGRRELSPLSDIDVVFLHPPRKLPRPAMLRNVLYPLWDAGFTVGHAVRTPKQVISIAGEDLHAATGSLSARYLAGNECLFGELVDRRARWINSERKSLVRRIVSDGADRHARMDRAGWTLAPDLKEDAGGLRDVHALWWIHQIVDPDDLEAIDPEVQSAYDILMAVREVLHGCVRRKTDRLRMDLQPKVASGLGLRRGDAVDHLMHAVHSAARTIEFRSTIAGDRSAAAVLGGPRRSGSSTSMGRGIRIEDGTIVGSDLTVESALRLVAVHAQTGKQVDPVVLDDLSALFLEPATWSESLRAAFVDILRAPHAVDALELLDHVAGWPSLLPEWNRIRGLAQYDAYHRYTVDGHSFVAIQELNSALADPAVANVAGEAGDLTTLYLACLMHDIGKGSGVDHSLAGRTLAESACERMGFTTADARETGDLVALHLLLPDTATRRDLDDGATIRAVAEAVGSPRTLRLLLLLGIADGNATGPEAWTSWKSALVWELFRKALVALETGLLPARSDVKVRAREVESFDPALAGRAEAVLEDLPSSYLHSAPVEDIADDVRLMLRAPNGDGVGHRVEPGTEPHQTALTLCVPDRPGALARSAGVLALHRISVLKAQAYSSASGLALQRFVVRIADEDGWDAVLEDLTAAYSGRLALDARLDRKIGDYRPQAPIVADVRILQDASPHSTVVEVRAPDTLGLLYCVAASLSDLDLDIHVAKIDTLADRVVDVFYVRTIDGHKLDDAQIEEVRRAIDHRVRRTFA